jgi:aspartyl aminopeptidase
MENNGNMLTRGMLDFIARSPDSWHAAANAAGELEKSGFSELTEGKIWKLSAGGKYFVRRNMSSLIAFRIPAADFHGFMIAAAHGDSPAFRIKDNAEIETGECIRLNVEKYGGAIYSTWLDRPLSVSGRIAARNGGALETRLVNIDRDLLCIPSLAIHMDRKANEGVRFRVQEDMLPLIGGADAKGALARLAAESAGVAPEDVVSSELVVYDREAGRIWGAEDEFVSSPRLDDLECVFSLLNGFLAGESRASCSVFALLDSEEIGSGTKQGAASTFLKDILRRVFLALGRTEEEYLAAIASSFMLSADNAHAAHPNHMDAADITNRPRMNGGVVLKFSGEQKYTTDAVSAAMVRTLCARAGVPAQEYYNNSDIAGGTTLGHLSWSQVAVNMADIGLAQLAMHSACETAGARDVQYMSALIKEFYLSRVEDLGKGKYIMEK